MAKEKINFEDEKVRLRYRHTTSHIMALAVKKLWRDAKLAIGPAIENGFYYDLDMEHKLNDQEMCIRDRNTRTGTGCTGISDILRPMGAKAS